MGRSFRLPDLGEGIHEGEILAVRVTAGQQVREGDVILEVETDKAAVEIPSPYTGRVIEVMVRPGDVVRVGDPLLTFDDSDGEAAVEDAAETSGEKAPVKEPAAPAAAGREQGPVPASPATRRLARELAVDLYQVPPSGPAGLVTAEDVRRFAEKSAAAEAAAASGDPGATEISARRPSGAAEAPPLPDFTRWGEVERVRFRSIRRATARQMSLAWSRIPHVNSQDEIDVTRLEDFRQKHKAEVAALGGRLTMTVFALKAAATALKTYPGFNASLDEAAGEIVIKKYFHVGVAVNTGEGLIVPVIRDVDRKSIKALAVELNEQAAKARERKIELEELQGGTFTITNIGAMGGGFFAPIINHPQVAILGMGRARMRPWVVASGKGHRLAPRLIMPLVLTIDHRVLDGADAIRFIQLVKEVLEDPDQLFMSMV